MSRYNKRKSPTFRFLFLLFLAGGLGYFCYYLQGKVSHRLDILQAKLYDVSNDIEQEKKSVKVEPMIVKSDAVPATTWIDIQRKIKNTVVRLVVDHASFNWLEPYKTPVLTRGGGTGFFINSDGDIVTNYHVVSQAQLIQIEIPVLGAERLTVDIVGVSPERDIALLRLQDDGREKIKKALKEIPFLKLGNSDLVLRGQDVLAVGYPLGVEGLKSTQGIVSGRERVDIIKRSCIQTTAPLNPGNSGGPAVNSSGEVIGVNFAGVVQAQNVGYILPINDLKSAIKDLYKVKLLRRPTPGCILEPSNEAMIKYFDNPEPGGYFVADVFKDMLFEKVGIEAHDMIYEINGFTVDRFGRATVPWNEDKVSMADIFERLEVGDKVDMVVYRKGERKEFDFILEPRLLQPVRAMYPDFEEIDYETIGGLVVMQLRQNHIPLLAENAHGLLLYQSPVKQYENVLVVSYVQPTSVAGKLRLFYPGSILKKVNGQEVKTLDQFRAAVRKSKEDRFLTVRTSENFFVALSVDEIVSDEDRLTKIYNFTKSSLIDDIK